MKKDGRCTSKAKDETKTSFTAKPLEFWAVLSVSRIFFAMGCYHQLLWAENFMHCAESNSEVSK
jgi:hypothetical protein